MFELMMTGISFGVGQFISSMMVSRETSGSIDFSLLDPNNKSKISYDAKLDVDKKNLHVTIDLDLNF